MRRRKGFTLIELLVVIAIIAILATLLMPTVARARELANQAACTANLNGIGKAVAMYAAEDKNAKFPLLWNSGDPESTVVWTDAAKDIEELRTTLKSKPAGMQNMWLIIDKGLVGESAFGCRSDTEFTVRAPDDLTTNRVGWQSSSQFSYGLHYPYKYKTEPVATDPGLGSNPVPLGPKLKGSFAIMADKNPGEGGPNMALGVTNEEGSEVEPSNHNVDGEVYLTYGGQVEMKKSLKDSLVQGDDIYTIAKGAELPTNVTNDDATTPAYRGDQFITVHPTIVVKP